MCNVGSSAYSCTTREGEHAVLKENTLLENFRAVVDKI